MDIAAKNNVRKAKGGWDDGFVLYPADTSGPESSSGYVTTWNTPIPVVEGHVIEISGVPVVITHCWFLNKDMEYARYYTFYNRTITVAPGDRFLIFSVFTRYRDTARIIDKTTGVVLFENGHIVE